MNEKENDVIQKLILENALEFAGVDSETGEVLYNFTNKLKDVMPDLYEEHINHVNGDIMKMWEQGFVNITFFDKEPKVTLTEKAFDNTEIQSLPSNLKWALDELKRLLQIRNL